MTTGDVLYILFTAWYCWAAFGYIRVLWFMVCPPNEYGTTITSRWIVAEYDCWIGAYIDRPNKTAYWFPVPCIGRKFWRKP